MIIPVAVQSCRLIPAMLLPPADPAGAKPRRDHRSIARMSRHEVPKTPGNDDAFRVYDPARVSHYQACPGNAMSGGGRRERGFLLGDPQGVEGIKAGLGTSVTASRMTDAYGASTPVGVHRSPPFTMSG